MKEMILKPVGVQALTHPPVTTENHFGARSDRSRRERLYELRILHDLDVGGFADSHGLPKLKYWSLAGA